MDTYNPTYFIDYLVLHLSIHPSISLSIHHRSFAWEKLTNRKRRLTFTLKRIPTGLSTAHHGAGKLSIFSVLAWFENDQYFVIAWRRRPLICVPVESLCNSITVGHTWKLFVKKPLRYIRRRCTRQIFMENFQCILGWFLVMSGCYFLFNLAIASGITL